MPKKKEFGTDPFNPDTDEDRWNDGLEVLAGTDPLDPLSIPIPMQYGQTLSASIDVVGEKDGYSFAGTTGDIVKVEMSDGSSSSGTMNNWIRIYDPSGVEIANTTGEVRAIADITLISTGNYLIVLADKDSTHTGGYTISLDFIPPNPPAGLTAVPGNTENTLNWDPVEGALSFNIYWNTSGSVTTADTLISGATSPHVHTGLTNGTTYFYIVTAVNSAGESDPSSEVSATPSSP